MTACCTEHWVLFGPHHVPPQSAIVLESTLDRGPVDMRVKKERSYPKRRAEVRLIISTCGRKTSNNRDGGKLEDTAHVPDKAKMAVIKGNTV